VTEYGSTLSPKRNIATYADSTRGTHDKLALPSIPTIRLRTWIVDSGAFQHVMSVVGEFLSYTRLPVSKYI
jgi:hypothetical protein